MLCIMLAIVLCAARWAHASDLSLEINGRDFYGSVFTQDGEMYAPFDVIGPLLLGAGFGIDGYDFTLQRVTFHYTPPGAAAPQSAALARCLKRGPIYVPMSPLLKLVGGSYAREGMEVRVAYPPAAAPMAAAPGAGRPTAPPAAGTTSGGTQSSRPAAVATTMPTTTGGPTQPVASGVPTPPAPTPAAMMNTGLALAEAQTENHQALTTAGSISKVEVYNPVSPDPSDAIPRTDLAGLKVYVADLAPSDDAWIEMWTSREALGPPSFREHLSQFAGQELREGWFFVRLPLAMEAGWHTVRIDVNHKSTVDYRFITY